MACLIIFFFVFMHTLSSAFSALNNRVSASDTFQHESLEIYIVHVSSPTGLNSNQFQDLESWHLSFLPKNSTGLNDASRLVYSYRKVISGFAARLSPEEVKEMEKKEGFLSARPQQILQMHTTHSPDFLGLKMQNSGVWSNSSGYGKGVIIGIIDTGITPGHPSFNDEGVPPPPDTWKGKCELPKTACNNKIIGARNFVSIAPGMPIDENGHGTHTASTAAGNFVSNATLMGQANGTAAGMAPYAHLAIYRVCNILGCEEAAVIAAMEAAVEDRVHVISISLGIGPSPLPIPFFDDNIAIGAFSASAEGIFVSCSAGNSGPKRHSLSNEAPWILTVGASTIDRSIRATVVLGNSQEFDGESLFQPKDALLDLLLFYGGKNGNRRAALCLPGSLNSTEVRGKVVLCESRYENEFGSIEKGYTVKDAGGAAMILVNSEILAYTLQDRIHVLPASEVSFADGQEIKSYLNSTSNPTARIVFKGTILGVNTAPAVTSFSSRGPNFASPGILKPDIIGPGLNILAAWRESVDNTTNTTAPFNIISGTSMSCPHLSGIVALIKHKHPKWSPAAIKSAIMTTADVFNIDNNLILDQKNMFPADIFAIGAGHVNPSRAIDPGLVYDITTEDYIAYLCGLGYKDKDIEIIVKQKVKCATLSKISEAQLNYPSFAIHLLDSTTKLYTRTVRNVGNASSSYETEIEPIPGVEVIVQPSVLKFTGLNEEMTYKISFRRSSASSVNEPSSLVQGAIIWFSKQHRVRSPISIAFEDN